LVREFPFLLGDDEHRMSQAGLTIETELEADGRFVAEVLELPGVLVYGATREDAVRRVIALALSVLAERIEHGEALPEGLGGLHTLQDRLFNVTAG